MIYFQAFRVKGVPNSTIYDDGLKSTEAEKKRLLSIIIQVNHYKDNDVEGWFEKQRVFNIPDSLLDTTEQAGTGEPQKSMMRLNEIEVGLEIPVGQVFKVAVKCGAATTDLVGAYRYELY